MGLIDRGMVLRSTSRNLYEYFSLLLMDYTALSTVFTLSGKSIDTYSHGIILLERFLKLYFCLCFPGAQALFRYNFFDTSSVLNSACLQFDFSPGSSAF